MNTALPLPKIETPRVRLKDKLNGPTRRQFAGDFRFLRQAGLSRSQAYALCMARYVAKN